MKETNADLDEIFGPQSEVMKREPAAWSEGAAAHSNATNPYDPFTEEWKFAAWSEGFMATRAAFSI